MADSNTWVVTPEGLKSGDTLRDDYIQDHAIICPICKNTVNKCSGRWVCTWRDQENPTRDCQGEAIYMCPVCCQATCRNHIQELI